MENPNPIKVLIVDDHAVVRKGLRAFLLAFPDLKLVGEARDGEEALQACSLYLPDVVLMDLIMPKVDGIAATRLIRQRFPDTQVIALTSFKEDKLVQEILNAGAIGYLLKNIAADDLADAIRSAKVGQPTLAPEATKALIQNATRPPRPDFSLTPRELEVLKLMVQGLNNPQIAETLMVSRSTVKFHVSSILAKLQISSRTEAVAIAVQNDLVET